ncbi:TPA: hypothetical protein DDW69_01600 [candidate division CPR2 bacterium]|uniref:Fibronectin type III domain protein n=1 Tax=candidate division CPR2 bacterium GW2011_GWC1_41_48 TaxID=1618344 RepID=A0A0G0Z9K8_UNCC2|nr:MAG: Fibronectin type III domain protein [candidate division CPR2 bacterium GW2011_GWC2_39_35]KKR28580.1 MAG: Fibronectin type III domain protein [candidate division CPR2 bacterium GW2011_GWD2_39_7]KKR29622.1 MAG: Fibronectin type III domain protein [candidate division CPR2 bacterium GW2011_GWD1_39_7]KKS09718.1 MAG: Fibronectin type III domain protein [candidate division CPR2 bacterium GW2011_GWC1_41_48]OGB56508.1 MAG: hypothetical protein A2Y27_01235 [candidate division CPR2 bacterium GWD1_
MSQKISKITLYKSLAIVSIFVSIIIILNLFPIKKTEAASVVKSYAFDTTDESWVGNGGAFTIDTYQSGAGNPAGALETRISGKNKINATAGWLLSGVTWESLGIPAGATVNSVDGQFDWRCSEYTTGSSASASGDLTITDVADGNITTVENGVTFGVTTSWATRNGSTAINLPAALKPSNTTIKIKLLGNLQTGNSVSAAVARQIDNISLLIDYTTSSDSPPTLTVNEPDGTGDTVTVGQSYNLAYDLSDPDSAATVDFYWDDGQDYTGTAISSCQDQPEGAGAICAWNTTGIIPGAYWIYGVATDGVNPDTRDYSPGQVTITASGPLQIKTVESFIGQDATMRTSGTTVAMPFSVDIPESNPTVKSAFFEITGVTKTPAVQLLIDVNIDGGNAKTLNLQSNNDTHFKVLYDATAFLPIGGSHTLNVKGTGADISLWSAKLILTYTYSS